MSERQASDDLQEIYLEALSRFDHFVMGATLAVCAYLAQSNPYDKIGLNIPTLYLISLFFFGGAAFCGFKRLEQTVQVLRFKTELFDARERSKKSIIPPLRLAADSAANKTHSYYIVRNYLLLFGFVFYIAAKVLAPYVAA